MTYTQHTDFYRMRRDTITIDYPISWRRRLQCILGTNEIEYCCEIRLPPCLCFLRDEQNQCRRRAEKENLTVIVLWYEETRYAIWSLLIY